MRWGYFFELLASAGTEISKRDDGDGWTVADLVRDNGGYASAAYQDEHDWVSADTIRPICGRLGIDPDTLEQIYGNPP